MRTTLARRSAAALLGGLLLLGAVGCSSDGSDGADPPGDSTADPGGSVATDPAATDPAGGSDPVGDPCQWYTADEMAAILGFPVTMEARTVGESSTCVYDAPDNYASVEITPGDDVAFDTQKSFDESADAVQVAGEPTTFDGLGDAAYGHESKGGVDINAVKGSASVLVLITNGGGGDGAGNVSTPEGTLAIARDIVTKVLG